MSEKYCFLKRSSSPQMVRSIEGHGRFKTSMPPCPAGTSSPAFVTTAASTPNIGSPVDPGFEYAAPGSVVIMIEPVSVCHHVSTIGQRPPPTLSWYQVHASGLMGSPTDP